MQVKLPRSFFHANLLRVAVNWECLQANCIKEHFTYNFMVISLAIYNQFNCNIFRVIKRRMPLSWISFFSNNFNLVFISSKFLIHFLIFKILKFYDFFVVVEVDEGFFVSSFWSMWIRLELLIRFVFLYTHTHHKHIHTQHEHTHTNAKNRNLTCKFLQINHPSQKNLSVFASQPTFFNQGGHIQCTIGSNSR